MEVKRKEKIEKARKLQEHYALYRLTMEFIDENKSKWENERKLREQERREKIENWEKKQNGKDQRTKTNYERKSRKTNISRKSR